MTYTVRMGEIPAYSQPDTTLQSVLDHIAVILATAKGSIPLYREFGLSQAFLDKPAQVARTMLITAIREAVERWEPRARVVSTQFDEDAAEPGRLAVSVEVEINGE